MIGAAIGFAVGTTLVVASLAGWLGRAAHAFWSVAVALANERRRRRTINKAREAMVCSMCGSPADLSCTDCTITAGRPIYVCGKVCIARHEVGPCVRTKSRNQRLARFEALRGLHARLEAGHARDALGEIIAEHDAIEALAKSQGRTLGDSPFMDGR